MRDSIAKLIERDLNIISGADNYLSFQFEKIRPYLGNRIIELGSGTGNHSEKIIHSVNPELFIALEKDPSFCRLLNQRFENKITVLDMDLDVIADYFDFLKSKKVNTVIALNVIEHLEDDFNCLNILSNIIVSGGLLIIVVPASMRLFCELDQNYGHYRRYSKSIFKDYANRLNLDLVNNSYFNMVGWLTWFVFAKLIKAKNINRNGMALFNKMLPLFSALENKLPVIPFGLSVMGVFRK